MNITLVHILLWKKLSIQFNSNKNINPWFVKRVNIKYAEKIQIKKVNIVNKTRIIHLNRYLIKILINWLGISHSQSICIECISFLVLTKNIQYTDAFTKIEIV